MPAPAARPGGARASDPALCNAQPASLSSLVLHRCCAADCRCDRALQVCLKGPLLAAASWGALVSRTVAGDGPLHCLRSSRVWAGSSLIF